LLNLTRKPGEVVVLRGPGCEVVLAVLRVNGRRVTLGFIAPLEVAINRAEVLEREGGELNLPPEFSLILERCRVETRRRSRAALAVPSGGESGPAISARARNETVFKRYRRPSGPARIRSGR